MNNKVLRAYRKKKTEHWGLGCFVQALGLAIFVGGCFLGLPGIIFGGLILVALLILGSHLSVKWLCGNCGNRIDGKQVTICPTCKAVFVPSTQPLNPPEHNS